MRVVSAICLVMLLVAGCSGSGSKKAAQKPAPAAAAPTPTTSITGVIVNHDGLRIITATANGSSPCEKAAPVAASPGQVGAGEGGSAAATAAAEVHGARGMVEPVALTKAERTALEGQMELARQVAQKYPTVKDAEKAGYNKSTPFVPCIGAHYTNAILAAKFDAGAPSELLYDGTEPDSKIVGLSYLVWHPGGPPPGFAGSNDHWHQHNFNGGLCMKGGVVIRGESSTRQECAAAGGRKTLLTDIWMVHAWIVPGFECTWGTFSGECPELGGYLCGSAWAPPTQAEADKCRKGI